ncbi:MAG: hypothetical protein PVF75_10220 [Granulosicoccaceae bacterium]|jgi:uncharacterized peroxidase-related enzyme
MKNGYQIHNPESGNNEIKAVLNKVQEHYRFVPNALAAMAESPQSVLAYLALDDLVHNNSLTDEQRHVAFLTISREYNCEYCVAAHTAFAQMGNVDGGTVQNLRESNPLDDPKLDALQKFVTAMVHTGCNVSDGEINEFLSHGYRRCHILDIITMIANKLIAIFANRVMGTDLDEMLQPARWSRVA